MTHSLALGSRDVALELYRVLREFDPAAFREELGAAARERLGHLTAQIGALLEASPGEASVAALRQRLIELRRFLVEHAPQRAEGRRAWTRKHRELQRAYEALAAGLRNYQVHVPSLRPTNYARNVFHVGMGLGCLALAEFILTPPQMVLVASIAALFAWSMEIGRRLWPRITDQFMRVLGRFAHPHEWHRVNSSTWYITGLLGLALTGDPLLCGVGVAVLTFADPMAAVVGRRYGRVKLVNGRSLEGSLAFLAVGFAAVFALVIGLHAGSVSTAALVALGAALPATVAELFSRRIDDNLSIPWTAAGGAWAVIALAGLGV
ncbi:MAG: hypothetical protein KC620_09030 [Myxococcales bacterium]|nr:hypothetical protein [Myxococcales bacterium]